MNSANFALTEFSEVQLIRLGAATSGLQPSIQPSAWKGNSPKFGLCLTVAVMFSDGALVLLVGPDMRVREARRALHSLLVHS
jgi:hypothetical protein